MDRSEPKNLIEALAYVRRVIQPVEKCRISDVPGARGFVLARNVLAPASLPRFDNAAMDGFAVHASDLDANASVTLKIAHSIAAGDASVSVLATGTAARIATGAPLPVGASRVVMHEDTQADGDYVVMKAQIGGRDHIRRVGEDVKLGDPVVKAGTTLHDGHLALLSALGVQTVPVLAKPRVGVLSTGDELTDIRQPLGPGRIYDTNRPMIVGMARDMGASTSDLGMVRDDPDAIMRSLFDASREHDLLITSGGASKGFADHLARVVSREGELSFWNLGMRPGKPLGFGSIGGCPILVLPGNPVASAAGFCTVGRSIIARLRGDATLPSTVRMPIGDAHAKPAGKTHLLMSRIERDAATGTASVIPLSNQGSASYLSLARSDVFVVLGADVTEVAKGSLVQVIPIWTDLFAA